MTPAVETGTSLRGRRVEWRWHGTLSEALIKMGLRDLAREPVLMDDGTEDPNPVSRCANLTPVNGQMRIELLEPFQQHARRCWFALFSQDTVHSEIDVCTLAGPFPAAGTHTLAWPAATVAVIGIGVNFSDGLRLLDVTGWVGAQRRTSAALREKIDEGVFQRLLQEYVRAHSGRGVGVRPAAEDYWEWDDPSRTRFQALTRTMESIQKNWQAELRINALEEPQRAYLALVLQTFGLPPKPRSADETMDPPVSLDDYLERCWPTLEPMVDCLTAEQVQDLAKTAPRNWYEKLDFFRDRPLRHPKNVAAVFPLWTRLQELRRTSFSNSLLNQLNAELESAPERDEQSRKAILLRVQNALDRLR